MVAFRNAAFAAGFLAAAFASSALGQINKCQTKDGRTIYQEGPCAVEDKASTVRKPGAGLSTPGASEGSASASARKPGLASYYTDGVSLFENASGAATSQGKKLGPLPF